MSVNKQIIDEWYNAVGLDSIQLVNTHVKAFRDKYPETYYLFHSFYRLRCELNSDILLLQHVGVVNWFTLTFDNKHDKSLVSTKRKTATRFLNDLFLCYLIVEEYGEDNNRYHIHGFGVFREGKGFEDFRLWHSRQKCERLEGDKLKRKVKYLTNYAVKDIPRLRRSKNLAYLRNREKTFHGLRKNFNNCYNCHIDLTLLRLRLGVI